MNAYSEGLHKKIVDAVEQRGKGSKGEATRLLALRRHLQAQMVVRGTEQQRRGTRASYLGLYERNGLSI